MVHFGKKFHNRQVRADRIYKKDGVDSKSFIEELNDANQQIFDSGILSRIATNGNNMPKSHQQRYVLFGKEKFDNAPRAASKYLFSFQQMSDMVTATQTPQRLISKTVNESIKYIPTKNSYSHNIVNLLESVNKFKNANEFYSFDLETLAGDDEFGVRRSDIITEVSFQRYKGKPGEIDFTNPIERFSAVKGLSPDDNKLVKSTLNKIRGGTQLSELSNRERVYISELIKYSNANFEDDIVDGHILKRATSKMSQADVERIVNSGNLQEITKLAIVGQEKLLSIYDEGNSAYIMSRYKGMANAINQGKNVMGIAANGLSYDIPFSRSHDVIINPNKVLDTTALIQMGQNRTGKYSYKGRQLETVFKTIFGEDSIEKFFGKGVAHIADIDTQMTAGVAFHLMNQDSVSAGPLSYVQDAIDEYSGAIPAEFKVGGLYTPTETIKSSNNGYYYNPITKEYIDDSGLYFREGVTTNGPESRVWLKNNMPNPSETSGYQVTLNKGQSYILTDLTTFDTSDFSDDFKKSMVGRAGSQYSGQQKLYKATFSPLVKHGYTGTAISDAVFILTEEDLHQKIGALEYTGTASFDKQTHAVTSINGLTDQTSITSSPIYQKSKRAKKKNLRENAHRSVQSSYKKLYNVFDVVDKYGESNLASAIAKNDNDAIADSGQKLLKKLRTSDSYAKYPEFISHMSTMVDNGLLSWLPVVEGVKQGLDEMGYSVDSDTNYGTRAATLDTIMNHINQIAYDSFGEPMGPGESINGIRLELPTTYRKNSPTTSYTINFAKENSQYNLFGALTNARGINTESMTPRQKAYVELNTARHFIDDALLDPNHGEEIAKEFKKKGFDKSSFFEDLRTQIATAPVDGDYDNIIRQANRTVFDILYESNIRSTVPSSNGFIDLGAIMREPNGYLMIGGVPVRTADELREIARGMVLSGNYITTPIEHSIAGVSTIVDQALNSLIDPTIRTADNYESYLRQYNFSDNIINARKSIYEQSIRDYSDYLKDLFGQFSKEGVTFSVADDGVRYIAPGSKEILMRLPRVIASDGVVSIKYGGQQVALNGQTTIKDGQLVLSSSLHGKYRPTFTINRGKIRGEYIGDTVNGYVKSSFKHISESADAFTKTANMAHKSGSILDVSNIMLNLFDTTDANGNVIRDGHNDWLSSLDGDIYDKIRAAWDKANKRGISLDAGLSDVSTEFYELVTFYQNEILESVADANPAVRDVINAAAAYSPEQLYKDDSIRIGPNSSAGLSHFQQHHRPTGEQTSKAQYNRKNRLKEYNIKAGSAIESEHSKSLNRITTNGVDIVNSATVNAFATDRIGYEKIINDYMTDDVRKAIDDIHGSGASDKVYRILMNASTENDGSIITSRLAMAFAGDNKNDSVIRTGYKNLELTSFDRKTKKEKTKALDLIPDIDIDPETRAVRVKYKDRVFAVHGESLRFHNKTTDLIEEKQVKRSTLYGMNLIDDKGTVFTETEASKILEKRLSGHLDELAKISNPDDQFEYINRILSKHNLSFSIFGSAVELHNKLGISGEEKTLSTALVTSLDMFDEGKAVLDRLKTAGYKKEARALRGVSVNDDVIDWIADVLGDNDVRKLKQLTSLPTQVLDEALKNVSGGKQIDLLYGPNYVKHKGLSSSLEQMLSFIKTSMLEEDSTGNNFNAFLEDIVDSDANSDANKFSLFYDANEDTIISSDNEGYINTKKLISKYNDLGGDPRNPIQSVTVQNLGDWEGKKYSGAHTYGDIVRLQEDLSNGKISKEKAYSEFKRIADRAERFGQNVNVSITDADTLNRQTWSNVSAHDLLKYMNGEGIEKDEFLAKMRNSMSGNILSDDNGKYYLSDAYRGHSFYEKTVAGMMDDAKYGAFGLRVQDYLSDPSYKDWLSQEDVELLEKYKDVDTYKEHTLEKLRQMDVVNSYNNEILALNGVPLKSNSVNQDYVLNRGKYKDALSSYNMVNVSDLDVHINGIDDRDIMSSPNNPYTRDTIIDLGEDFANDNSRYLAVKGMPAKYYDGENALLDQYQKSISGLYDKAHEYKSFKNGTLSTELQGELFKDLDENADYDTKLNHLKQRVLSQRSQIIEQQAQAVRGKKGFASMLISPGPSTIAANLKSQTIADNAAENLMFGGMTIGEHRKHGREISHATVGRSSFENMGFYDDEVVSQQLELLKNRDIKLYDDLSSRFNGNKIAMADELYSKHGVTVIAGKTPHIGKASVAGMQLYMDDTITDGSMHLNRLLQDMFKNDDDGDSVSVYRSLRMDENEAMQAMTVQSISNYKLKALGKTKVFGDQIDLDSILSETTIFGRAYTNLEDHQQWLTAKKTINESKFKNEFDELYGSVLNISKGLNDRSMDFIDMAGQMYDANTGDLQSRATRSQFVDEMESLFVAKTRLARNELSVLANASKAKVGNVNNAMENLFNFITDYSNAAVANTALDESTRSTRELIADLSNSIKEISIENTINAKNLASNEDGVDLASRMIESSRMALYNGSYSSREQGMNALIDAFGSDGSEVGKKIDEWIVGNAFDSQGNYDAASPLAKYLSSHNIDMSGATTESVPLAARQQLLSEMKDTLLSASSEDIKEHLDKINYGVRGGSVYDGHMDLDYDGTMSNRAYTEHIGRIYSNYAASDTSSAPTNKTITRTLGQMSADLLQNVSIGKGVAVGALGLAAGIMAAGFIGGNPSHAPQDDAPQLANPSYQNDNYNYDTGMVMAPPQMPQHGYVVNMRASTNGNYGEAQRYIAQATQQSYVANMNLNVRQNFSYSGTKQSNDRYVENMITRLLG